ncbi:MAG: GGDEF domain-containing protein [Thalassolituus sp.]
MIQNAMTGMIRNLRFTSITNPMDWQAIDRFILLATLVLLAPVGFGAMLWVTNQYAPEYLNQTLVPYMLWGYAAHVAILFGMILEAIRRRGEQNDWPMFENVIIGSYLVVVLGSSYLVGAHFSEGLLLIFLGVNITGTLASINKIKKCYWLVIPVLFAMGVSDFLETVPYAILLEKSPVEASGRPMMGWLILRSVIVAILAFLIYLCILAMKRWVERENLYLEMSTIDGLTRLSNRNSLLNKGEEEIARTRQQTLQSAPSLACIMIDLDHFKRINDTWGHHAGDAVLVAASKVMMETVRKTDEVGRYGGEEFAVLLPGTNMHKAAKIAEILRKKISNTRVKVDGQIIEVTASFGVAAFPSDNVESLNDLLKAADKALYEAKDTGRNKVVMA